MPSSDVAVNEAYDGFGATYKLYYDIYQRNSIDGDGLPINGYVHYGRDYDNAFWDGKRMNFGFRSAMNWLPFTALNSSAS